MADGSVTRRGDGWRARYRHQGKQHQKTFPKLRPAQQWLRDQLKAIDDHKWIDPADAKTTVREYYDRWAARQIWTSGTVRAMDLAVLNTPFVDERIGDVQRTHVEAWVKAMSTATSTRKALAPGTIKTRHANVRAVFRAAVRDRVIAFDPTENVRLPAQRRREASMTLPSPDDVRRLLEAAEERFVALVAVCAFAGLRLGEAAALRFSDVDFLGRTLTVSRQVQRENGGGVEIRLPKYGSERVVPISDALVTILSRHLELGHRGDWMFNGAADDPPHQNTVGYWWRKTMATAGLKDIKLHDLRHFYASGLIAAGCDVVTVQRALGHSSAAITLTTYSHLWPTAEDRTRKASAGLLDQVLPTGVGTVWAKPAI